MVLPKTICEGCGRLFSSRNMQFHYGKCLLYLEWSKCLPFPCPCGRHFVSKRSLFSHKKGCDQAEMTRPGGRVCGCGQTYWSLVEHRQTCTGVPVMDLPLDTTDPGDRGCPCGKVYSADQHLDTVWRHRQGCAFWHAWEKTLPVKCQGCGKGFRGVFGRRAHTQFCKAWQDWKARKNAVEKTTPCPSCGEMMRSPQLGRHVNSCPGSWTADDWQRHRRQGQTKRAALRDSKLEQGKDYVVCSLCGDRFRSLSYHLTSQHGLTVDEYRHRIGGSVVSEATLAKRLVTSMARYGAPTPLRNPDIAKAVEQKRKATCQARYGADSPFSAGLVKPLAKNRLERRVEMLGGSRLVYTGDHKYWIQCRDAAGKWINRNPDFVVYDVDQLAKVASGVYPNSVRTGQIVEVLGDYFHGQKLKGMSGAAYAAMRLAEYASVNVQCLIIWESEVKADIERVRARLAAFIAGEYQEDDQQNENLIVDLFGSSVA